MQTASEAFESEAAQAGGAGRDRTGDLLNANQALSQLSYSPFSCPPAFFVPLLSRTARRLLVTRSAAPSLHVREFRRRYRKKI